MAWYQANLDPLGDGSLAQSYTFNTTLDNLQATDLFTLRKGGVTYVTEGIGDGSVYFTPDASEFQTTNGNVFTTDGSIVAFFYLPVGFTGSCEAMSISAGEYATRNNLEIIVNIDASGISFSAAGHKRASTVAEGSTYAAGTWWMATATYDDATGTLGISVADGTEATTSQAIAFSAAYDQEINTLMSGDANAVVYIEQLMFFTKAVSAADRVILNTFSPDPTYGESLPIGNASLTISSEVEREASANILGSATVVGYGTDTDYASCHLVASADLFANVGNKGFLDGEAAVICLGGIVSHNRSILSGNANMVKADTLLSLTGNYLEDSFKHNTDSLNITDSNNLNLEVVPRYVVTDGYIDHKHASLRDNVYVAYTDRFWSSTHFTYLEQEIFITPKGIIRSFDYKTEKIVDITQYPLVRDYVLQISSSHDKKLYVGGGYLNYNTTTYDWYSYDLQLKTWTALATIPVGVLNCSYYDLQFVVHVRYQIDEFTEYNKILIFSTQVKTTVLEYDVGTDSWETIENSWDIVGNHNPVSVGNKVYFQGIKSIVEYDVITRETITYAFAITTYVSTNAGDLQVVGDRIYLSYGGYTAPLKHVQFDTVTKQFTSLNYPEWLSTATSTSGIIFRTHASRNTLYRHALASSYKYTYKQYVAGAIYTGIKLTGNFNFFAQETFRDASGIMRYKAIDYRESTGEVDEYTDGILTGNRTYDFRAYSYGVEELWLVDKSLCDFSELSKRYETVIDTGLHTAESILADHNQSFEKYRADNASCHMASNARVQVAHVRDTYMSFQGVTEIFCRPMSFAKCSFFTITKI